MTLPGYEVVFNSYDAGVGGDEDEVISVEVYAPEGKVVVGGGVQHPALTGCVYVLEISRPIVTDGVAAGWIGQTRRLSGTPSTLGSLSAWVICVDA
jgi:hypothetical protein